MAFPMFTDNFVSMEVGEKIDLGRIEFIAAEPVVRDIRTLYGVLFTHNEYYFLVMDLPTAIIIGMGIVENLQKKQNHLICLKLLLCLQNLLCFGQIL